MLDLLTSLHWRTSAIGRKKEMINGLAFLQKLDIKKKVELEQE